MNSAAEVRSAMADARNTHRKDVLVRVSRQGQHLFVTLDVSNAAG